MFLKIHPICRFEDLEAAFCKRYRKVQTYEQEYMVLLMIKQCENEKVEVKYERILKLANCLQHQINDNLFTTFFQE
jgi:hypothetical protein